MRATRLVLLSLLLSFAAPHCSYLEAAAQHGCDLFVTGELAERAGELAKELQITLVAAGHYATEVFGAMRLADELGMKFPALSARFVDVPSPL